MKHTAAQVRKARETLSALPALTLDSKEELSLMEAIKLLSDVLVSLKKKGYSVKQMVQALNGQGIEITQPTLRRYLNRLGTAPAAHRKAAPTTEVKQEPAATRRVKKASADRLASTTTLIRPSFNSGYPVREDTKDL